MKKKSFEVCVYEKDVKEVVIDNINIPVEAIYYAMRNGIINISKLDQMENDFFKYFECMESLEEKTVLRYFNALEIYLDKRNMIPSWCWKSDPNNKLWDEIQYSLIRLEERHSKFK